jgi:hypothetical protein
MRSFAADGEVKLSSKNITPPIKPCFNQLETASAPGDMGSDPQKPITIISPINRPSGSSFAKIEGSNLLVTGSGAEPAVVANPRAVDKNIRRFIENRSDIPEQVSQVVKYGVTGPAWWSALNVSLGFAVAPTVSGISAMRRAD